MKLFCWYEHQIHHYFRVGPLQAELLSMHPKPEVVMIHNALGHRLLAFLRSDAGRNYYPSLSIHANAYLTENSPDDGLRRQMLQLTSRISGLKTNGNPILVKDHAAGGFHKLHMDSVRLGYVDGWQISGCGSCLYV